MKTKAIQFVVMFFLGSGSILAQDIPANKVPSIVVDNFKKEFPKANDVEWELSGERYKVEFEIGWATDYEALFTATGKLHSYTVEISKKDLPQAVKNTLTSQYKGFRIDDAKKINENGIETFFVEIEKGFDERKLIFSANGKLN